MEALKKYAQFSGRASRNEFWMFFLFYVLGAAGAMFVDVLMGNVGEAGGIPIIYSLFIIAMIVPYLAVAVRRFHDINRSGWSVLITLVPLIGAVLFLIGMVMKGTEGQNKYGPDPLREGIADSHSAQQVAS